MNSLVTLAKQAVETFIKKGRVISPPNDLPEEFLSQKSGTFVTIMKEGRLRGCIGTYLPTKENIAEETIHNAIAAVTKDYRFRPVQEQELPYLSYTVYILSKPELVKEMKKLNPKKYGIIVKTIPIARPNGTDVVFNGHYVPKSGLLLPDLEGIETIEQQISLACRKGGIDPKTESILIYRFTVKKYKS